jgi:hypothetical protein
MPACGARAIPADGLADSKIKPENSNDRHLAQLARAVFGTDVPSRNGVTGTTRDGIRYWRAE